MTFLGQFIDHDLTFDAASQLGVADRADDARRTRARRASISTRCTALGPIAQSELYDPAEPIKLRLESGGLFEDLPAGPTTRRSSATRATTRT